MNKSEKLRNIKTEYGKGSPSRRWLLRHVLSQMIAQGRKKYTFLCMFVIAIAVIHIILPDYWTTNMKKHSEKLVAESMNTMIITNCENINNPASMFTEDKIKKEFLDDPRIVIAYGRQELGVKLDKGDGKSSPVSAEGIIPEEPTTNDSRLLHGRGVSSLTAREIVIPTALYSKIYGNETFKPGMKLNLCIGRTVENITKTENISVSIAGVLKSGVWNKTYVPKKFLEHLHAWSDNQIDVIPSEGGDMLKTMPEISYKTAKLYVNADLTKESLKEKFDYYRINTAKHGEPFYEVLTDSDTVRFAVRRTDSKGLSAPVIYNNIRNSVRGKGVVIDTVKEAGNIRFFTAKSSVEANVLAVTPDDSRIARAKLVSGRAVSGALNSGNVIISQGFDKKLKNLDGRKYTPKILHCDKTIVANSVTIGGVAKADLLVDDNWDMICTPEQLSIIQHKTRLKPVCIVATSDPRVGYDKQINKVYGRDMEDVSADVADILYFTEEYYEFYNSLSQPYYDADEDAAEPEKPEPPRGFKMMYEGLNKTSPYDIACLFVPDDVFKGIAKRLDANFQRNHTPAIAIVPSFSHKEKIEAQRKSLNQYENTHVGALVFGEYSGFLFSVRAKSKICPKALPTGYISVGPVQYGHGTNEGRVENTKSGNYERWSLSKRNFLFRVNAGKKKVEEYFNQFDSSSIWIAEVLRIVDMPRQKGFENGMFVVASPTELRNLPYSWAKDYASNAGDMISQHRLKSSFIKIGDSSIYVRNVKNEIFPKKTVLVPAKLIRNNKGLVSQDEFRFNRIDISCPKIKCVALATRIQKTLRDIEVQWLTKDIRIRKLDCYEFSDAMSTNDFIGKDLLPAISSLNPPFYHVIPDISLFVKPSKTSNLKGFDAVASPAGDVRRFSKEIIEGSWISSDDGILLPASALEGSIYKDEPRQLIGKYITTSFDREFKRSLNEPKLDIRFKVEGVVAGKTGHIPMDLAKKLFLWHSNSTIVYIESENRFMLPSEIYSETGYNQVKLFAKELKDVRAISADLRSRRYNTYDSLAGQENAEKLGKVLTTIVFILTFGTIVTGIATVVIVTMMNKESRIHELANLKSYGTSRKTLRSMFILSGFILGLGAYIIGVTVSILIEPAVRNKLQTAFFIKFDEILAYPLVSIEMWRVYALAFVVSVACCVFSVFIAYLNVRNLSVVDIFRKQF